MIKSCKIEQLKIEQYLQYLITVIPLYKLKIEQYHQYLITVIPLYKH